MELQKATGNLNIHSFYKVYDNFTLIEATKVKEEHDCGMESVNS